MQYTFIIGLNLQRFKSSATLKLILNKAVNCCKYSLTMKMSF